VTSDSLARSYLLEARKRLKALAVLGGKDAHSDVVPEAQELVELALKVLAVIAAWFKLVQKAPDSGHACP
jgi:hypothetical protein